MEKHKNQHSDRADIFIIGSLPIKPNHSLKNRQHSTESLGKTTSINEMTPTVKISEDNILEFNYHPIDLSITDTNSQKVVKNGKITLRVIDKSECSNNK